MDDASRRRRQYEAPVQRASNQRYQVQAPPSHGGSFSGASGGAGGGPERYRTAPHSTSPSTPRTMGIAGNYSPYYQEQQSAFPAPNVSGTMGYGTDYGADARGQSQSFGNYNAGMMMYNVPQPSTQTPVYDAQPFAQRQQQSAMPMIAPDVASSYFGSEAGAAPSSVLQHTSQGSSAAQSEYPQQGAHMTYGHSLSGVNSMQQQGSAGANTTAPSDGQEYRDAALEEKWLNYQRQLGTVFQDVKNGSLESASETLLGLSNWLLTQVADLGLSQDDASLHDERIKLWNDFNHAWLALGFQQKRLMESGQQLSRAQRLMSEERIKRMGDELVRLCDGIERHGLVDYQYGVWEEQIESILEECLDIFEIREAGGDASR